MKVGQGSKSQVVLDLDRFPYILRSVIVSDKSGARENVCLCNQWLTLFHSFWSLFCSPWLIGVVLILSLRHESIACMDLGIEVMTVRPVLCHIRSNCLFINFALTAGDVILGWLGHISLGIDIAYPRCAPSFSNSSSGMIPFYVVWLYVFLVAVPSNTLNVH